MGLRLTSLRRVTFTMPMPASTRSRMIWSTSRPIATLGNFGLRLEKRRIGELASAGRFGLPTRWADHRSSSATLPRASRGQRLRRSGCAPAPQPAWHHSGPRYGGPVRKQFHGGKSRSSIYLQMGFAAGGTRSRIAWGRICRTTRRRGCHATDSTSTVPPTIRMERPAFSEATPDHDRNFELA